MNKVQKAAALQRIANFYEFNQRERRILDKIDAVDCVGQETSSLRHFNNFVHATVESETSFFSEQVKPRIENVNSKHWEAFLDKCGKVLYQDKVPGTFSEAVQMLAFPGLDKERLEHIGEDEAYDKIPRFLSVVKGPFGDHYSARMADNALLEYLGIRYHTLTLEEHDNLLNVLDCKEARADAEYVMDKMASRVLELSAALD